MKLDDITPERLQKLGKQELLSLHIRVHQLYPLAKARKNKDLMKELYNIHRMIVDEMMRRGINHNSPLDIKGLQGLKL